MSTFRLRVHVWCSSSERPRRIDPKSVNIRLSERGPQPHLTLRTLLPLNAAHLRLRHHPRQATMVTFNTDISSPTMSTCGRNVRSMVMMPNVWRVDSAFAVLGNLISPGNLAFSKRDRQNFVFLAQNSLSCVAALSDELSRASLRRYLCLGSKFPYNEGNVTGHLLPTRIPSHRNGIRVVYWHYGNPLKSRCLVPAGQTHQLGSGERCTSGLLIPSDLPKEDVLIDRMAFPLAVAVHILSQLIRHIAAPETSG